MRGLRLQRGQQREVQLSAVGCRVCAGLLGERVDVVIGCLEGHGGAHDAAAQRAWRQHREGGRAFEVAALGALRRQREPAQRRVGNLLGPSSPLMQLESDLREDAEPVAAGRSRECLRQLASAPAGRSHSNSFAE
jgi:hypothetical protein